MPCHRVVRTDGTIGQYSLGGPGNKRTILTDEGVDLPRLEELASSGIRFIGSDTTKIFCLPTCRHARRGHRPAPPRVPFDGRGTVPRLPRLQGVPAGIGRGWPPDQAPIRNLTR